MNQVDIAKRLLEGRSCDTCLHSVLINTLYCRINGAKEILDNPLYYQKISKNNTCKQWGKES